MAGVISQGRERRQFRFGLMKTHCCSGRLGGREVGRGAKGFLSRPSRKFEASGGVGFRWQAVFGSSDRLGLDRPDAPGHAAGRGMAGPEG